MVTSPNGNTTLVRELFVRRKLGETERSVVFSLFVPRSSSSLAPGGGDCLPRGEYSVLLPAAPRSLARQPILFPKHGKTLDLLTRWWSLLHSPSSLISRDASSCAHKSAPEKVAEVPRLPEGNETTSSVTRRRRRDRTYLRLLFNHFVPSSDAAPIQMR